MEQKIYYIKALGCANCAAKMEAKINALPGVEASITFATGQLRVRSQDPDALLPQLQRIVSSFEPDAVVCKALTLPGRRSCSHHHCDHDHEHEHEHEHKHEHKHSTACENGVIANQSEDWCGNPPVQGDTHRHRPRELRSDGGLPRQCVHWLAMTKNAALRFCNKISDDRKPGTLLLLGAGLFAVGLLLSWLRLSLLGLPLSSAVFAAAYLLLGGQVLLTAGKHLLRGHVFDENFLMSLATLGAFAIGQAPEAVGVMLFYRVGEYFEHRAVAQSRKQILEALDLRPETVLLLRGEQTVELPAADARPGDLLLVRPGDRIPLDGVIVSGKSFLDTSPITGEPVPVAAGPGSSVTSGCLNTQGQLTIRVEKPLAESTVTRILDAVENAAAGKPKAQRFISRFSRIYTPAVVAAAVLIAFIPSAITGNWHYWVYTALSFLVMSCPCALVLSVPLAFFSGIGVGGKKGILFKSGLSIEALADIRAAALDKTGTLTKGEFTLLSVSGPETLLALCAGAEQASQHPIGKSIVEAAKRRGLDIPAAQGMEEFSGEGISCCIEGRHILCGNLRLMERFHVPAQAPDTRDTLVLVAVDGSISGHLTIGDGLKPHAASAVAQLHDLGIHTAMLTGDTQDSARAAQEKTGIRESFGKLLPQDKLTCLRDLRQRFGKVLFVGDGINDAPVLAGADVGAAMGSGSDAAIEAADVVYLTSDVRAIPESIRLAKDTQRIARQNVVFALGVKAAVMALGLLGFANLWLAVFADSGVAMLCVLNSIRLLKKQ